MEKHGEGHREEDSLFVLLFPFSTSFPPWCQMKIITLNKDPLTSVRWLSQSTNHGSSLDHPLLHQGREEELLFAPHFSWLHLQMTLILTSYDPSAFTLASLRVEIYFYRWSKPHERRWFWFWPQSRNSDSSWQLRNLTVRFRKQLHSTQSFGFQNTCSTLV